MARPSPALVLLPASLNSTHPMQRAPLIFDYLPHLEYLGIKGKRIRIPFTMPQNIVPKGAAQFDYISNYIRNAIHDYRMKSYDNFGIQVQAYPVPSAFEFRDTKNRWIGFNKYVFEAFATECKEMYVTVDHKWDVKIDYLGSWKPIAAYLENVKPVNPWADTISQYDLMHQRWRQQADWWRENGKVFPLKELPAEIREIVYEHVWGPFVEPYPISKQRKLTAYGKYIAKLRMPNGDFLKASREVAEEAGNILFMRSQFLLQHYGVFQSFTGNVEQRSRVKNLTLALPHQEFMRLFSTDHVRKDRKTQTEVVGFGYPALALRTMVLNRLRLVFKAPSLTTGTGTFDGACQRIAIDVIMEAAWPVIRGHPVSVHGYIKDIQKKIYDASHVIERKRVQAWRKRRVAYGFLEGSLADYDEEVDDEEGGVPLDGSRPVIAPEEVAMPEYDLTCHCDPPCTEETWSWE